MSGAFLFLLLCCTLCVAVKTIKIDNDQPTHLKIYWLNSEAKHVYISTIDPFDLYSLDTSVDHEFVLRSVSSDGQEQDVASW